MGGSSDAVKVNSEKDNIFGIKRQQELKGLLDILERSKAEIIFVESQQEKQIFWDSIYHIYYKGGNVQMKNEIFQVGIRLAERLGIKQGVTCVDWSHDNSKNRSEKYFEDYSLKMNRLADSLMIDENNEFTVYDKMVLQELNMLNNQIPDLDLISVYTKLNSEEYLKKFYYGNITTFMDKNTEGIGAFKTQYNMMRNINIYGNIIKIILKERPEAVLVLYGAGHVKALKDMFEAHPAIEVIEFDSLLTNK